MSTEYKSFTPINVIFYHRVILQVITKENKLSYYNVRQLVLKFFEGTLINPTTVRIYHRYYQLLIQFTTGIRNRDVITI